MPLLSPVRVAVRALAAQAFDEFVAFLSGEQRGGGPAGDRAALEEPDGVAAGGLSIGGEAFVFGSARVAGEDVAERVDRNGTARQHFGEVGLVARVAGDDGHWIAGRAVKPGEQRPALGFVFVGRRRLSLSMPVRPSGGLAGPRLSCLVP
jgi:hypothetical protein